MSRSALQKRLERRGKPTAADWLYQNTECAVLATALWRTFARMAVYVLVIAELIDLRQQAMVTWPTLIAGGFIADISSASTFELLFLVDALTFVPMLLLLMTVLRGFGEAAPAAASEDVSGGYADVLRDRTFLRVFGLMLALTIAGFSQLESGFPAYATGPGGVGTAALGLAFAVVAVIIIGATIRMTVLARSKEISIMRLVGATELTHREDAAGTVLAAIQFRGYRKDLTTGEEAAAYAQLAMLDMTDAAIARATGEE